jgi:hypothetical protein
MKFIIKPEFGFNDPESARQGIFTSHIAVSCEEDLSAAVLRGIEKSPTNRCLIEAQQ